MPTRLLLRLLRGWLLLLTDNALLVNWFSK